MVSSLRRIPQFDGLRGIAALIVVVSHITAGFVPALYFGSEGRVVPEWQNAFAMSPLFVTISGSFAVFVFFVLSGFVISASADTSRSTSVAGNCLARIVRLGLPCAASVLLAGALGQLNLFYVDQAASLSDHWWLKMYKNHHSTWEIFQNATGYFFWTGTSEINGVLWTMQRELLGSLAIYVVFGYARSTFTRLICCALIAATVALLRLEPQSYLCFAVGSAIFLIRGWLLRLPSWLGLALFTVGLVLGGRPYFAPQPETFYDGINHFLGKYYLLVWPTGAALVVCGAFMSVSAIKVLGGVLGRFLGRISFGVYLVHFPLLHSLMAYLYLTYGHTGVLGFAVVALLYLGAVILIAFAFTIFIDEPGTNFARVLRLSVLPLEVNLVKRLSTRSIVRTRG